MGASVVTIRVQRSPRPLLAFSAVRFMRWKSCVGILISRVRVPRIAAALLLLAHASWDQDGKPRTVHVFVALADNDHQGIVPVARILGNGEDPEHNLYWGSA